MAKSLPTGGCQQGALPEGDAANFHPHQASSSLLMSAVHPGLLLTSERPARSETQVGGVGLEAFPKHPSFPLPFPAPQLPRARVQQPPCPSRLPPTLLTTRKFSRVFPLEKTRSPVSFTASGRISFTS